jgi:hypothetical protein
MSVLAHGPTYVSMTVKNMPARSPSAAATACSLPNACTTDQTMKQ